MIRAAAVVLAVAALAGTARADEVFERDAVDVDAPPGIDISRVAVDNRLGSVTVRGHDGDGITIHAFKRAPDDATLERLKVSLVPDPDGPVTIHTRLLAGEESRPIPAGSIKIDLVLYVPRSARVEAAVWNGKVAVEGVDNGAELRANEGAIDVKQVSGGVSTQIAHGKQDLTGIFGAVEARGLEGDLDMVDVSGDSLAASIHRGRVSGRAIRVRELDVRTIRGSIQLEGVLVAGGRYRVSAYRGNIELRFASGPAARVVAVARSGTATLPSRFEPHRDDTGALVGAYGSGRNPAEVHVTSGVGHITVAQF